MSLPEAISQDFLLTLNTTELEPLEDAVPGVPGVDVYPLFLDVENGTWVLRARFKPGVTLPTHFHTGTVHFYTLSGCWHYLEHPEDKQTAGSYLYEPGGSVHTFHCPADSEGAEGFMVVTGTNVNFDAEGNYINCMDAGWIEQSLVAIAKERGIKPPRYIKPKRGAGFSDAD